MNRYQIITYDTDYGDDEKLEYKTIKEALKAVKEYLKEYECAFVYDKKKKTVRHAFNTFPQGHFAPWVNTKECILHF